jgi:hypothetical protein
MADPLDEYLTPPLPHTTLTGRPVRISEPHIGTLDAATPSEAATRSRLRDWGVPQRVADWIGSWAPWTPPGAGYDAGSVIGAGMAADNPGQVGLGVGLTALAALPLGIRARVPASAPARETSILSQYGSRQPPPITGHNIGSLQMPRVPRQVDPELGLYSAADEAGHSYPRTAGTARDIQDWMHSQGVTANEMAARGLTGLFSDPRRTITRQELLGHLSDNPIRLQAARYQGSTPEPDLRSMSRARMRGEDGEVTEHIIEDRSTGRQFTILEDHDAGNIGVRTESGAWLEVPGRINNQRYDHGIQAIGNYLARQAESPGAAGPVRYGPRDYPDLSLNAERNPTYQENVLFAPRRYRFESETPRPGTVRDFTDQHYPNEPNPIGWIRSSTQEAFERGPGGDANLARPPLRGVLWDELQMPMAQRIRDQGARNEALVAELQARMPALNEAASAAEREVQEFLNRNGVRGPVYAPSGALRGLAEQYGADHPISQEANRLQLRLSLAQSPRDLAERELATATRSPVGNPFVNDTNQALRTLMHFGLQDPRFRDPNIGGVFLTPAQMQIERYNLARHVGGLRYNPEVGTLSYMEPRNRGDGNWRALPRATGVTPETLPNFVGADVSRRLLAQPLRQGAHELTDLGALEVGGRGMRENYDRIYPETLDAILRRLDPAYPGRRQVALSSAPYRDISPEAMQRLSPELRSRLAAEARERAYYSEPVHYFPFTDRIRRQIERGLPYFGGAVAVPTLMHGARDPLEEYSAPPRRP